MECVLTCRVSVLLFVERPRPRSRRHQLVIFLHFHTADLLSQRVRWSLSELCVTSYAWFISDSFKKIVQATFERVHTSFCYISYFFRQAVKKSSSIVHSVPERSLRLKKYQLHEIFCTETTNLKVQENVKKKILPLFRFYINDH